MANHGFMGCPMSRAFPFWITACALACGLLISFLSWTDFCSEACYEVHAYRLFGMSFESVGFVFFPLTLTLHILGNRSLIAKKAAIAFIATAAGSEISFLLIQKYEIGTWCLICLSVAAAIGIALTGYIIEFIHIRGNRMKNAWIILGTLSFTFIGLVISSRGIAKDQPLLAAEKTVQESITFGTKDKDIDVYLFTDWQCRACRKLEPSLVALTPKILDEANLIFVDAILHVDTLNYMPYNLSFMMNNKEDYLQLRSKLTEISKSTGRPTDTLIEETIAPLNYKQLQYADIAVASKYFKELVDQYEINVTPTLVIVNRADLNKRRKLSGREINEPNIHKAIHAVKQPQTPPTNVKPKPVHVQLPPSRPLHVQPTKVQPTRVQPTRVQPTNVQPIKVQPGPKAY